MEHTPRESFGLLNAEQIQVINHVLEEEVHIHGQGNYPTLEVKLKDLIHVVHSNLKEDSVTVRDIRLNGSAASHVLNSHKTAYNDLDLIFGVELLNHRDFEKVKTCVLHSLLEFLPEEVNKQRISDCSLKDAYVQKMVKVCNDDRWSLISLNNNSGRNVELKFVSVMKRQFEFSVDSFQIILDPLLSFYANSNESIEKLSSDIVCESLYGNFKEALGHLNDKLIYTIKPEEIRGGGLLKYCNLLMQDYQAANLEEMKNMERYMCSRFFIDFNTLSAQREKIESYLTNHFIDEECSKYTYLRILYRIVEDSTVCLMGHERRRSLQLIQKLSCQAFMEEHRDFMAKQLHNKAENSTMPIAYGNNIFYAQYEVPPSLTHYPCAWMPCV